MNIEKFLESVGSTISEATDLSDEKGVISYIKKLAKKETRFNDFLKNRATISTLLRKIPINANVREVTKTAMQKLSKDCYQQGGIYLDKEGNLVDRYADKIVSLIEGSLDKEIHDVHDAGEMSRVQIEKIFQSVVAQLKDKIKTGKDSISPVDKISGSEFNYLRRDRLEKGPDTEHYDLAVIVARYVAENMIDIYNVIFVLQGIIADVVRRVRVNKSIPDGEKKSTLVMEKLTRYYQQFLKEEFGTAAGELIQTLSKDHYRSSQDKKNQEDKLFSELIYLVGV
jgi:hypothetical protein